MEYNDKHVFTEAAVLTDNGVERLTREQIFSQFKSGIHFCTVGYNQGKMDFLDFDMKTIYGNYTPDNPPSPDFFRPV